MLLLYILLIIFQTVKTEIDDYEVQALVNIITKSQEQVRTYKPPKNAYEYESHNLSLADWGEYDYIIVGAGSSGSVLATRLSEDENVTILLLEAGGEESTFSDIPAMMVHLQGTKYNWNFETVPQTTCCLGLIEQRCGHPRGKGLGGTSILNAAMYVRGNKYDYDSWAKMGNSGWSYQEVLPYFIKSENSQIEGDSGYHGKGGLFNVEYRIPPSQVTIAFLEANQELGRKIVDYNGREQLGIAHTQFNTIRGHRQSTGKAFLSKARFRKNLTILTQSYAKRVLIENKSAYGVEFDHDGLLSTAKARKEVILSAGAFGSPHLLMMSGVGPKNVLKPLEIPIVSEIPVGANYQDHPTFYGMLFTTNYTEPIKNLYEYSKDYLKGIGAFTIGSNAQAIAFLRTNNASTPPGVPDIEVILIPQNASNEYTRQAFKYTNETYNTLWPTTDVTSTFTVFLMLLHPKSKGTVSVHSSNPYDYPKIDANFLSDEQHQDIETMYQGVNMVKEMLETNAFRKINAKLHYLPLPACSNYTLLSKEQWFCQIRHLTTHIYHPVGTCKMAPIEKGGVVDNKLKVHGVKNLRVADTSIIPESTSGHPGAVAVMIAEKLSDILKQE